MKKQLRNYFKSIKKNLPCLNSAMRKMLDDLRLSVESYIQENNVTDFAQIEGHFGAAENIAKEFAAGIDNSYVKSYKFKKRVTIIVVCILAAIMIAVSTLVIYIIVMSEKNTPIDVSVDITYSEGK